MYKVTKNNQPIVTLNSLQSAMRYIGLNKSYRDVLAEGWKIQRVWI